MAKRKDVRTHGVEYGSIRVKQSAYRKAFVKKVAVQTSLVLLAVTVLYVGFAATIIRFVPTQSGLTLIKNNTYGNAIPQGTVVLVNPKDKVDTSFVGNLTYSLLPQKNAVVAQIHAGPFGNLKWTPPNILTVNGAPLPIEFPTKLDKEYLENEYVGVCLKGACQPGSPLFFSRENVYGIPLKASDFNKSPNFSKIQPKEDKGVNIPSPAAISPWVTSIQPAWSAEKAECVSRLIIRSKLPSEALAYIAGQIEAGKKVELNPADMKTVNEVFASKDAARCRG